jgi:hypothetical protein
MEDGRGEELYKKCGLMKAVKNGIATGKLTPHSKNTCNRGCSTILFTVGCTEKNFYSKGGSQCFR